jgi:CBS domain-containing protein
MMEMRIQGRQRPQRMKGRIEEVVGRVRRSSHYSSHYSGVPDQSDLVLGMVRPEYIVVRTNNISCLRVALVTAPDDRLLGIVTDGDVRKALLRGASLDAPVGHHMNTAPITGRAGLGRGGHRADAGREIRHLPLVDAAGRLADMVLLDDVLARVPLSAAAVIMAGGMSTRRRPLTEETPKPLLRVGGRPLIEILMPTAVAESPGAATPP